MPQLIPILRKDEIKQKVAAIAERISSDYAGSELVVVGVLKGAFVFLSDLIRCLTIPVSVEFVRASSYGAGTDSTGTVKLTREPEFEVKGKHVLIVEDIVDTGLTLSCLVEHFHSFGPKSVRICTLIDKRERREKNLDVRYACHVVKEGFLADQSEAVQRQGCHIPDHVGRYPTAMHARLPVMSNEILPDVTSVQCAVKVKQSCNHNPPS